MELSIYDLYGDEPEAEAPVEPTPAPVTESVANESQTPPPAPLSPGTRTQNTPLQGGSIYDMFDVPEGPVAAPADEGFFERTGRKFKQGVATGLSMNPRALEGIATLFEDDDPDPNSTSSQLAAKARGMKHALETKDESKGFLDSTGSFQDMWDYLTTTVGSGLGSTAAPIAGAAAGAVAGSVVPGVGTGIGALAGSAAPAMFLGIGNLAQDLREDPVLAKKLADGEIKMSDLKPWAVGGGLIIGALDVGGLQSIAKAAGLNFGKEQVEAAVKLSIRKAIVAGAKGESITEAFQQVAQEVTTALSGGSADVKQSLLDVFEAGVAGGVAGGALGGAGRTGTKTVEKIFGPGGKEVVPGADPAGVDQKTPPDAGISTPGGTGAPPPAPAGPSPAGSDAPAETKVVTSVDPANAAAIAGVPTQVSVVAPDTSAPVPVTTALDPDEEVDEETAEILAIPEMEEAFKIRPTKAVPPTPKAPAGADVAAALTAHGEQPEVGTRAMSAGKEQPPAQPVVSQQPPVPPFVAGPPPVIPPAPMPAQAVGNVGVLPESQSGQIPTTSAPVLQDASPTPALVEAPVQQEAPLAAATGLEASGIQGAGALPAALEMKGPPAAEAGEVQLLPEGDIEAEAPLPETVRPLDVEEAAQPVQSLPKKKVEVPKSAPRRLKTVVIQRGVESKPTPSAEPAAQPGRKQGETRPSRASEAAKQLRQIAEAASDLETGDARSIADEILRDIQEELETSDQSIGEMVRTRAERVKRLVQEKQESRKADKETEERVRSEAEATLARQQAEEKRATGTGQEKARTTKEGKKPVASMKTEEESSFIKRARKVVKKQGDEAPAHYKEALAAYDERVDIPSRTKKGSEEESRRAELNKIIRAARDKEIEEETIRQKEEAVEKAERKEKQRVANEAAIKKVQVPLEDKKGEELSPKQFFDRVGDMARAVFNSVKLPNSSKTGKPVVRPHEKYPDWVNFALYSKRIAAAARAGTLSHEQMAQYVTAKYLFDAGKTGEAVKIAFAAGEEAASATVKQGTGTGGAQVMEEGVIDDGVVEPDEDASESIFAMSGRRTPPATIKTREGTEEVPARDRSTARAELNELTKLAKEQHGIGPRSLQVLRRIIMRRLISLVGDTPVYYVDSKTIMDSIHESKRGEVTAPEALFVQPEIGLVRGAARGKRGHILIDRQVRDLAEMSGDYAYLFQAVLHETLHAATAPAIEQDWNGSRRILERLHAEVLRQAPPRVREAFPFLSLEGKRGLHEFMAEALSNEDFQTYLMTTPVSASMQRQIFGREMRIASPSWWDAVVRWVSNAIGLDTGKLGMTALESIMRILPGTAMSEGEQTQWSRATLLAKAQEKQEREIESVFPMSGQRVQAAVEKATDAARQRVDPAGWSSKARKFRNIVFASGQGLARLSRRHWGDVGNPVERALDVHAKQRTSAMRHQEEGDAIAQDLIKYFKTSPAQAEVVAKMVNEAQVAKVDPRLTRKEAVEKGLFSNKGILHEYKRNEHARLHAIWNKLPPEAKALVDRMETYYKKAGKSTLEATTTNLIKEWHKTEGNELPQGVTETDVLKWTLSGDVRNETDSITNPRSPYDDAMHEALGTFGKTLADMSGQYNREGGLYSPLMREGDYLVAAEMPVEVPKGAVQAKPAAVPGRRSLDNVLVFNNKQDVLDYQQKASADGITISSVASIWVDPNTGKRSTKLNEDTEQRWVVTVNNRIAEFHDSLSAAQRREAEWRKKPGWKVHQAAERDELLRRNEGILPNDVQRLTRSIEQHHKDDKTKSAMITNSLRNAAVRQMAGNRVAHRFLKRKGTAGYSNDLAQAMISYNNAYGFHMASLQEGVEKWELLQQARDVADSPDRKYRAGDDLQQMREILSEVEKRFRQGGGKRWGEDAARILTGYAGVTYLASPAYNILNMMQYFQVTAMAQAADYGLGSYAVAMSKAMKALGGLGYRNFTTGVWDTAVQAKKFATGQRPDSAFDFYNRTRATLAKLDNAADVLPAFDYAAEIGLFDGMAAADAEISEYGGSGIQKFVSRMGRVFRAMPEAIEANNRVLTILTEAILAKEADPNISQEKLTQKVKDRLESTQGGYGKENQPRAQADPRGAVLMQFKKYGWMMANLFGQNIMRVLNPQTKGERIRGAKSLAYLTASHVALAGLVGFPFLEVARVLSLVAAPLLGGGDWDDYENAMEGWLGGLFGAKTAEMMMRGPLSRAIGIDLSNRSGADSMITYGSPRNSNDEESLKAWIFNALSGPSVGMATSFFKALSSGDWTKLPMPKFITDAAKAFNEMGGVEKRGKQTSPPQSIYETAVQAAGFKPASKARVWESGPGYKRNLKGAANAERNEMMDRWLEVPKGKGQGSERARIFREVIRPWNKGKKGDDRINVDDLVKREQGRKRGRREEEREFRKSS